MWKAFAARFARLKTSRIIWYLTCSDIFTWALHFAVASLVAIYVEDRLGVHAVQSIGIGMAIYSIARASTQIPFGVLTDKIKSSHDEIIFLGFGNLLMGFAYIGYPFVQDAWFYYLLQLILGFGAGLNVVTWRKLFAKNLAKDREGVEYGIYETFISVSLAIFSAVAGSIAEINETYFAGLILTVGVLIMSSTLWPYLVFREKFVKDNSAKHPEGKRP